MNTEEVVIADSTRPRGDRHRSVPQRRPEGRLTHFRIVDGEKT